MSYLSLIPRNGCFYHESPSLSEGKQFRCYTSYNTTIVILQEWLKLNDLLAVYETASVPS